jgi:hypothetical protein
MLVSRFSHFSNLNILSLSSGQKPGVKTVANKSLLATCFHDALFLAYSLTLKIEAT